MEHNEQMILRNENRQMEKYISILEEVEAHNCRINRSLRMGSGWLMDTHKMILLKKP